MPAEGGKRILVAIDGSSTSRKAADEAIRIAQLEGGELILMTVLERIKQGGAIGLQSRYGGMKIVRGFKKIQEKTAKEYLAPVEQTAKNAGLAVKTEILDEEGSEVKLITEYAKQNHIDLIVIGAKGASTFRKLLMGSVADAVVKHAPCPVLVVR